jgi:hypothetical protein
MAIWNIFFRFVVVFGFLQSNLVKSIIVIPKIAISMKIRQRVQKRDLQNPAFTFFFFGKEI